MHIKTIEDFSEFMRTVDNCRGPVYLISQYGDMYNLKSKLTQFIVMYEISKNPNIDSYLCCNEDVRKSLERFLK